MLRELTVATNAQMWAILSLLFFFSVFAVVLARVLTRKASHYDTCARLPLDDLPPVVQGSEVTDG
ncbi:MAG: hypothetical protein A2289_15820 [Deltaproteobacteria bacterium RIFOXYA12_FULL_58_15]|nr:MAG: hypothetical protein A2289_15820 [Deltaproteobacteria bacterium RIFOXYA12_FULL_58_15]OGR14820.1 MAG: hypothetical protein A2341_14600 [Deltaproteobacteria bacterium RIFOXYB12_FULL_58_9]